MRARLRLVTQGYWSRHALSEALGVVPAGVSGIAAIQGLEAQVTRKTEVYSYGGLVYGLQSNSNRLVREWTVGANYRLNEPALLGSLLVSMQYSRLDRATWPGGAGAMDFLMCRFRYAFN